MRSRPAPLPRHAYQSRDWSSIHSADSPKDARMFTDTELAYLASQRLGRLATQKPDGTLQNSPVGFRYNETERTIDIGGLHLEDSRTYRNVAANGRVAFVVDDLASVHPWRVRCVEIRGDTEAHSLHRNARDVP